jgi:transcriptional regulator with XRE-family HTH domain
MVKTKDGDLNPDPKLVRKLLGENIRKYRNSSNLSQMALASDARLELSTIHRIESGKTDTNISTLARIRVVLKVPWNKMLQGF